MSVVDPSMLRSRVADACAGFLGGSARGKNAEISVFNAAVHATALKGKAPRWADPGFASLYLASARRVLANLGSPRTGLSARVKAGEVSARDLGTMTHQEMHPELWRPLIDAKIARDKSQYEIDLEAASDEFKCFKCKKRKCTYYELQTRSADEPMTTFVSCLSCGNHWKC
jgi:transcription elongation factor S-II